MISILIRKSCLNCAAGNNTAMPRR
jgi:hypothetical protein